MSTLNYLVKGKKNFSNILIRFKNGRKFDYTISSELKVEPKNWSQAKQKVKNTTEDKTKDAINNHLSDLKKYIIDNFNLDNATGTYIDKEWLNKKVALYFNRPLNETVLDQVYFIPFIENYIKEAPTRIVKKTNKPVSSGTITRYKSTLKKLQNYEEHFKTKIKFTDLDLKFHKNFLHIITAVQNIGSNTAGKYISSIKSFGREAILQGLPVNSEINHPNFFVPTEKTQDIYLTDKEINKIYKHNFNNNDRLANARDLFIIGLRTGLRVSDFLRLKQTNIIDGFIEIETQKTGQEVVIPMHWQVKDILERRKGFPNKISDQKFNLYIKEVTEISGLKELTKGSKVNKETNRKEKGTYPKHELITSHICRRSFASNLYGELPNMAIMGITGHKTETQFLKYIKITPKENANKLKEYWAKQNEQNSYEQLKMKVVK
jgi:integrase